MEKNNLSYFGEKFDHLQTIALESSLNDIRQEGFALFNEKGLPTYKTEEWKYTGVSSLFQQKYQLAEDVANQKLDVADLDAIRLPGYENANELVFLNGKFYTAGSKIISPATEIVVLPLEEAAKSEYKELVKEHLNQSGLYIKDAIHALNTSFIYGGVFIYVPKNQQLKCPVYLYHISDTRKNATLAQPRSLFYVETGAKLQVVETYKTFGNADSFTNEVLEIVVKDNAHVEY
jgi:Fe-S cluster assembly protein SufD